ncbi:MAG TPA: class I SAM-dependent methyltransferase [Pseudonocardiaceae bacterium]
MGDLGCGSGRVTAHLRPLGLSAFGVDLSSAMVALARRAYPGLRFDQGSITAVDATAVLFPCRRSGRQSGEEIGVGLVDLPLDGNHGAGAGPRREDGEEPTIAVAERCRAHN